jgi:hypothetical protein
MGAYQTMINSPCISGRDVNHLIHVDLAVSEAPGSQVFSESYIFVACFLNTMNQ